MGVQTIPTAGFDPAGPMARLVITSEPGTVVSPTTQLVYSAVLKSIPVDAPAQDSLGDPSGVVDIQTLNGAVAETSAVQFSIVLPDDAPLIEDLSRRALTVSFSRPLAGAQYEIAIASNDLAFTTSAVANAAPDDNVVEAPPAPLQVSDRQELVLLSRKTVGGADRILLAVPMRFAGSTVAGVLLDITLTTPAPALDALRTAMQTDIASAFAKLNDAAKASPASAEQASVSAALDALRTQGASRGAIIFLARQTGAKLSEIALLPADEKILRLVVAEVNNRVPQLASRDAASVGWLLDRCTIKVLASLNSDDAAALLPPVQGALGAYVGEAGRQLDLLQSIAGQSASSADLYQRVIAEHLISLDDNSPALRVRAYDWLNAQQLAPKDYDPLAAPRVRRASLQKFEDERTAAATRPALQK